MSENFGDFVPEISFLKEKGFPSTQTDESSSPR